MERGVTNCEPPRRRTLIADGHARMMMVPLAASPGTDAALDSACLDVDLDEIIFDAAERPARHGLHNPSSGLSNLSLPAQSQEGVMRQHVAPSPGTPAAPAPFLLLRDAWLSLPTATAPNQGTSLPTTTMLASTMTLPSPVSAPNVALKDMSPSLRQPVLSGPAPRATRQLPLAFAPTTPSTLPTTPPIKHDAREFPRFDGLPDKVR